MPSGYLVQPTRIYGWQYAGYLDLFPGTHRAYTDAFKLGKHERVHNMAGGDMVWVYTYILCYTRYGIYPVYTRYIPTPQIRAWAYTHFWACSWGPPAKGAVRGAQGPIWQLECPPKSKPHSLFVNRCPHGVCVGHNVCGRRHWP